MAPRCSQALFHIVTFCLVAGQSIKYGLKGQEVKLKPEIQNQQSPDNILWMHNDNKVVEFNGNEEEVFRTFKNRITLDWHSAELHLTDLRSEDSGLYELEVNLKHLYSLHLKVIDEVTKPTITCETNTTDSSEMSGLLTCSAAQPDVAYEWLIDGSKQSGPQLRIFLGSKSDERGYICHVSNPLSNETATFTARDCYSGESAKVLAVVLIVLLLLLLLLAVVAAIVIYRRYKGKRQSTETENTPSAALQDVENDTGALQNSSPQSQNHEKLPLPDQERSGEDDAETEPSVLQYPTPGYVERMREKFDSKEVTPVRHRHDLENNTVALQNLSAHSQNHEKLPLLDQKRSDEDDESAVLASELTSLMENMCLNEPDSAETQPSGLKSPTKEPLSDADNNKEEHQASPCSPADDEQPASLDDSILFSGDRDDGDQFRQSTPVPQSSKGRDPSEDADDNKEELQTSPRSAAPLDDSILTSGDHDGGDQIRQSTPVPQSSKGRDPSERENSDWNKDDHVQFNPPAVSPLYTNSANMASKDAAGEDREISSDQLLDKSDTSFEDAGESGTNSTFFSFKTSDLDWSQLEAEKGTRLTASSVETEQNKENSAEGDNKENV